MPLTYGKYLKVPELLALQQGLSDPPTTTSRSSSSYPRGLRAVVQAPAARGRQRRRPPRRDRLRRRLAAPSLSDAADALLVRRGFAQDPPPASPPGGATEPQEWRLRALVRIYEEPDTDADLVALCEVLIEMDECLALRRAHHVQMVERMIGAKRGTGGSGGVAYLRSTLPKRAFPGL